MGQSKEDLARAIGVFEKVLTDRGAVPEDIGRLIPRGTADGGPEALLAARRQAGPRGLLNHVAYRLERAKEDLAKGELKLARRNIFWISGAIYAIETFAELDGVQAPAHQSSP